MQTKHTTSGNGNGHGRASLLDDRTARLHRTEDERSMGEIGRDLAHHAQDLVRAEVDRAKVELAAAASAYAKSAAVCAGAMLLVFTAVILLGIALAQALSLVMPDWAGSLVSAGVLLAIAGVAVLVALRRVRGVHLAPTDAISHAKEDIRWVKTHT